MLLSNKIGFSTNIFDNPQNIGYLIESLGSHYSVIEIELEKNIRNLIDMNPDQWKKEVDIIKEVRNDRNLYFSIHGPYIGEETDISNSDETTRLIAVEYMSKYIKEASKIGGIEYFTIHPGYLDFDEGGIAGFHFEQLRKSIATLNIISQDYGIQLLLENTGADREKYIVVSDEQHEVLCGDIGIYLTLDLVHFESFMYQVSTKDYFNKLRKLVPFIKNAHFNDVLNGKHVHLPLNQGNFDYHRILCFMVEENYSGNFIIEESGGGFPPEDFVKSGIKYIDFLNNKTKFFVD